IGRRTTMAIAFGGGAAATYPVMSALAGTSSALSALGLVLLLLTVLSGYTAVSGLVKAELFPANVRALGVALPYAIANALFGGTAEYAALWFKSQNNESAYFWYVTVMIGISLIVFVFMRDTKHKSMITHD